jgi:hypothetical protein
MTFDTCFLKTGTVANCLTGNGENGEDITCDTENIDFVLNPASRTSLTNWLTKVPPTPTYISGPMTLTRHTFDFAENVSSYVYIFGERHGYENSCKDLPSNRKNSVKTMEIQDFLINLAKTSPVFLDIFIELSQGPQKYSSQQSEIFMVKIYEMLKNHIPPIKGTQNPDYERINNVRIHAIDIRHRSKSLINNLQKYISKVIASKKISSENVDYVSKILTGIISDNYMKIDDFIQKYLIDDLVRKELDRLENGEDLLHSVKMLFGSDIEKERKILSSMLRFGMPSDIKSMALIRSTIVPLYSYSTDIYLLARMFKTFKTSNELSIPMNIIIYAGEHHANVYRSFLDSIEYKSQNLDNDYGREGKMERCLHVNTKIAYPLFGVSPCDTKMMQ